jgi:hypothetical protein
VLACLFAVRWIPETKGRSLEQIEYQLGVPAGAAEDAAVPQAQGGLA